MDTSKMAEILMKNKHYKIL